jgi:hypothetical protein
MVNKLVYNPLLASGFQLITDGTVFPFKGVVAAIANLPLTGNAQNDVYIVSATDRIYTWNSTQSFGTVDKWVDIGAVSSIDWSSVANRPSSLVTDIDSAVSLKHSHANAVALAAVTNTNTGDQDLSGKVDKVSGKGLSTNDFTDNLKNAYDDAVSNKADKVTSSTSGHFAGLDSNGNLTDSGSKPADFAASATAHSQNTDTQLKSGVVNITSVNVVEINEYAISRDVDNSLFGTANNTHVNLGRSSVTGTTGQNYTNATVGGGVSNQATRNGATVTGGTTNTAAGVSATVGGGISNQATNQNATVCGGTSNTSSGYSASGEAAQAIGTACTASGQGSSAEGYYAVASLQGQFARASGRFAVPSSSGAAQISTLVARTVTTNNTPTILSLDGTSSLVHTVIPTDSAWGFQIVVTAIQTAGSVGVVGDAHAYRYFGLIKNIAGTVTIPSYGVEDMAGDALWAAVAILADNTNKALQILVTGITDKTIRWVARIELTEVKIV